VLGSTASRAVIGKVTGPIGTGLARIGVSPDVLTIVGTIGVVVGSVGLLARGHFVVGTLVVAVFVLSDLFDGAVARAAGTSGPWGAWLDSTLDRVGDAAVLGSLAWWYDGAGGSRLIAAVAFVGIVAGAVTSYAKARAEGLGMTADVGIAERSERLILTLVACFLDGATGAHWIEPAALWLLAVLSTITAGQRALVVRKQAVPQSEP
jgi:CDP-diacylglycerol--glycerol-3-phosphate 3-phosphatidyltransferase